MKRLRLLPCVLLVGCQAEHFILGGLPESGEQASGEVSDSQALPDADSGSGDDSQSPAPEWTNVFAAPRTLLSLGLSSVSTDRVAPHFVDWNHDGALDLAVSDGDGRLWVHPRVDDGYAEGELIWQLDASVRAWDWTLVDYDTDGQLDIVIVDDQSRIRWYAGQIDGDFVAVSVADLRLPAGCEGRLTLVDGDGDGALDVVASARDTGLWWSRNLGAAGVAELELVADLGPDTGLTPEFIGQPMGGHALLTTRAGGTSSIYPVEPPSGPGMSGLGWASSAPLRRDDGHILTIDEGPERHTRATMVDVNSDGVLDLVVGRDANTVVVFAGVPYAQVMTSIEDEFEAHDEGLTQRLAGDEATRWRLSGNLAALREALSAGLVTEAVRAELDDRMMGLLQRNPDHLQRRHFDPGDEAAVAWMAAQFWLVLRELRQGDDAGLGQWAELAGFDSVHRSLLVDHGVLYVDNDQATPGQLQMVVELLEAIPPELLDVTVLLVSPWLGEMEAGPPLSGRAVAQIFTTDVGVVESIFPDDEAPGACDLFAGGLVHELGHHTLDRVARRRWPQLYAHKFELLARAAGEDFHFHDPVVLGVDWQRTQQHFATAGYWDGAHATWAQAYAQYFEQGPGSELDSEVPMANLQHILAEPHEAFATLAGQYFCDTRHMLATSLARFDGEQPTHLAMFLHYVDYFSARTQLSLGFRIEVGGPVRWEQLELVRDDDGRIVGLTLPPRAGEGMQSFVFERDVQGRVVAWRRL